MNCRRSPRITGRSDRVRNLVLLLFSFVSLCLCAGSLAQQNSTPAPRSAQDAGSKPRSTNTAKPGVSPTAAPKVNEKKTDDFFSGGDNGQPKGPTEITA